MTSQDTAATSQLLGRQVDDEIAQAIGRLFIISGMAEQAVGFQLLRLAAHPNAITPQQFPLVSGMELNVKLALVRVQAALLAPSEKREISKICDDIRDAFEKRNEFAHSVVTSGATKGTVSVQRLKVSASGSMPAAANYSVSDISGFVEAIRSNVRALSEKLTRLGCRPPLEGLQQDPLRPSR